MTCESNRRAVRRGAVFLGALGLALGPQVAWAWATYDQLVDWDFSQGAFTGSRSTSPGGGLTGYNQYSRNNPNTPAPALQVDWEITLKNGTYHYKYTFTGDAFHFDSRGRWRSSLNYNAIDHIVVDVGDDCGDAGGRLKPECATAAKVNGKTLRVTDPSQVRFGDADGIVGGIRLGSRSGTGYDGTVYEFDSARGPAWGHLAISDHSSYGCANRSQTSFYGVACTEALVAFVNGDDDWGNKPTSWFIPVVDVPSGNSAGQKVPEPTTLLLMASGLVAAGWLRRMRRNAAGPTN